MCVCVCVCVLSKPQMNESLFSKWIYNGSISQTKWDVICFRVLKNCTLNLFLLFMSNCSMDKGYYVVIYLYYYIYFQLGVGDLPFWATRKTTEFSQSLCGEVSMWWSDLTSKLKKGQNTWKRGKMCMTSLTNNGPLHTLLQYFARLPFGWAYVASPHWPILHL